MNGEGKGPVVVWLFLAAVSLVVVSGIFTYRFGLLAIQDNREITRQVFVLSHLGNFLSALKDAETGQRGFLLTDDESYLQPYRQGIAQVQTEENGLRQLAATGALPAGDVDRLLALTRGKLAEMSQTIQLRSHGLPAALAVVRSNRGRQIMDDIRATVGRMQTLDQNRLTAAGLDARRATAIRTGCFIGMGLIDLIFLAWAFAKLSREVRRREAVLSESHQQRELLHTTLASIGDAVIVTDARGRVAFLNDEAERLTGWKTYEADGQLLPTVFKIINERTRQPSENPVEKVLREGTVAGLGNHTILIAKDGRETPIDDSAAPIREQAGPLLGVVLVFRDFTEQRRNAEISARLAAIVEHSGDAIISKTLDGIIRTWNAGAERLLGYRPEEIIGKSILTIIPPERHAEEDQILAGIRGGKVMERFETIRQTKDGRRIHVSIMVSPMKNAEGQVIGASKIMRDISDIVAAHEALSQEKELLHTTLSSIGDAVIVADPEGRVTFLNREAEQLTGWHSAEAHGQCLPAIFNIVNETTRQPVENPVRKVLRLGMVAGMANHTVLISKDGRETPIDDSAAPIRKPDGPLFGVVLVFRNFAEQREAQRVLTRGREELEAIVAERTARLQEAVEELRHVSYSITHDMRAPLRAMNVFAEQLLEQESGALSASGKDYLRRIIVAADRFDRLIRDALNYTKTAQLEMPLEPVNLSKLLQGIIETYPNLHPVKASVRVEGELPVVFGNESLLTQCFSNLLGNAVKFVPPGVKPEVRVTAETTDGMAKIWIKDNGIGIPGHAQRRLFKMFQKLDDKYEGTGIGLAIVRKVVERMSGKVGVQSEAGQGSNFWVELPLAPVNAVKKG